jgi:hypothetical protein
MNNTIGVGSEDILLHLGEPVIVSPYATIFLYDDSLLVIGDVDDSGWHPIGRVLDSSTHTDDGLDCEHAIPL